MSATSTAWEHGRLDSRSGSPEVLFGRMYEDAAIETEAFPAGGRIFCIASAGCTALGLAPRHEVVAVDINPEQVAYARRRFLGDRGGPGRAERGMERLRRLSVLAGWSEPRLRAFLDLDDPAEQVEYWRQVLDTRRFRAGLNVVLSVAFLRFSYAPRLIAALPRPFGPILRRRMARGFSIHPNRHNPYARMMLLGEVVHDRVPSGASSIRVIHADAASFLEQEEPGSYEGFALSNILDGAGRAYRERLFAAVRRAAAPGAVVVLRSFCEPAARHPSNRAAMDRSMLWGTVLVLPASQPFDSGM